MEEPARDDKKPAEVAKLEDVAQVASPKRADQSVETEVPAKPTQSD